MNKDSKMLTEAYGKVSEESFKTFSVALDRPGAGYSDVVKAKSKQDAIKIATKKYREAPDTVYEVEPDYEDQQKQKAEQEKYNNLGADGLLIALSISGALRSLMDYENKSVIDAVNNFIALQKKVNPHRFEEIANLISV